MIARACSRKIRHPKTNYHGIPPGPPFQARGTQPDKMSIRATSGNPPQWAGRATGMIESLLAPGQVREAGRPEDRPFPYGPRPELRAMTSACPRNDSTRIPYSPTSLPPSVRPKHFERESRFFVDPEGRAFCHFRPTRSPLARTRWKRFKIRVNRLVVVLPRKKLVCAFAACLHVTAPGEPEWNRLRSPPRVLQTNAAPPAKSSRTRAWPQMLFFESTEVPCEKTSYN